MRCIPDIYELRGLQLYQFRITDEEFDAIKNLLSQQTRTQHGGLANDISFQALFVLYAAEWWRRYFDGSRWTWEPIIDSIDGDSEQWKAKRSECIRKGLKHWQIPIHDSAGLRYLGAIALQGGLPVRLLQTTHGDIGGILNRVLILAENSNASESQVRQWVESKKNSLPKSYHHESIYYLLAQVICTTLALKSEAKLKENDNAVAVLNNCIPDWKKRFPISLDDTAANALLNQLVADAANIQRPRTMRLFPVVRILQAPQQDEGNWHSYSDIDYDTVLKSIDLQRFFKAEEITSHQLQLCLQLGNDHRHTVALRKCAGHEKYRMDVSTWHTNEADAYKEHRLTLRDTNGNNWSATATAGDALDATLPWLFTRDECNRWQFKKQGGGKLAATEVLLVIPKGWQCPLKLFGQWENRNIFQVTSEITVKDLDNQCFRIRPSDEGEEDVQYIWQGDRIWDAVQTPSLAFRNIPTLHEIRNNSEQSTPISSVAWRRCGEKNWQYQASRLIGPVEARYRFQGELKLRNRMVLLPSNAKVRLQAGTDPTQGIICFEHWGISHARLLSSNLTASCEGQGDSFLLNLRCSPQNNPPECVDIELNWSHTTTAVKVRYPFPATGARLFDGNGLELRSGSRLPAYHLLGYRLWAFGSSQPILKLDKIYKPEAVNERVEIHLMDYESNIQRMLSCNESSDAFVDMALETSSKPFRLRFLRYAGMLEPDTSSHQVLLDEVVRKAYTPEKLAIIPVYALRLDVPGEEPEKLNVVYSEGVAFGGWKFDSTQHTEAPWLIYASVDSEILLRPLLWPYEYDEGNGSLLSQAIRATQPDERKQKLDKAIEDLANDYSHEDWIMVEQLAKELGHLPLVTLDIWKRFSRVAQAMAALVFRMGSLPEGFIERFAVEMPFVWEVIPSSVWLLATENLKRQCVEYFGSGSEMIFNLQMKDRVEKLLFITPSLAYLLGWVKSSYEQEQQIINSGMDIHFNKLLFEGDTASIHKIRRSHSDESWPSDFEGLLGEHMQGELEALGYHVKMQYRSSIINLPIILAYWAATESMPSSFCSKENILAIREHQHFDPKWFSEAFDLTIVRCLARGLLKTGGLCHE